MHFDVKVWAISESVIIISINLFIWKLEYGVGYVFYGIIESF